MESVTVSLRNGFALAVIVLNSTPNPGKFGAVAEGDLYQPESGAEPVKKGRTGTNPVGGWSIKLDRPSGTVLYGTKTERGVLDKSKISRGGSLFLSIFKLWYKRTR